MKKLIFCALLMAAMATFSPALADDVEDEVSAQDLGVTAPTVLPDSRFYFLKDWQRNLKIAFTFNQIKKAEVRQQIVNEKLVELKALAAKTQDSEMLEKTIANSQKSIERLKNQIEKFKDNAQTDPEVGKFLDKFVQQGLLQQRILEELENKVPPQAMLKIEAAREKHMEKFGEVMSKLEDKDKIAARINNALENRKGEDLKELKNLQILKKFEDNLPAEVKDSIKQLQNESLNVLMKNMTPEKQERIGDYLQKMGGDKEKQLEILETLKEKIGSEAVQNRLEKAKNTIIKKIEQSPRKENCPLWTAPTPDFCKQGKIVINKDLVTGCKLPPKCVTAGNIINK